MLRINNIFVAISDTERPILAINRCEILRVEKKKKKKERKEREGEKRKRKREREREMDGKKREESGDYYVVKTRNSCWLSREDEDPTLVITP